MEKVLYYTIHFKAKIEKRVRCNLLILRYGLLAAYDYAAYRVTVITIVTASWDDIDASEG